MIRLVRCCHSPPTKKIIILLHISVCGLIKYKLTAYIVNLHAFTYVSIKNLLCYVISEGRKFNLELAIPADQCFSGFGYDVI